MGLTNRLQHAWNAFMNKDPTYYYTSQNYGSSYGYRPDRPRLRRGNDRSIITSVFNRIALDVAAVDIKHCRLDNDGRYVGEINSDLNNCLTLESNIDQTARSFVQDCVLSMFDEGCVALVPVDTTKNPALTDSYDILTMRTGEVLEWKPNHVKVRVYNDRK